MKLISLRLLVKSIAIARIVTSEVQTEPKDSVPKTVLVCFVRRTDKNSSWTRVKTVEIVNISDYDEENDFFS